jgi:hypothetical protein
VCTKPVRYCDSALAADSRRRWIETLKLDAVAVLLIIAFVTAVFPSLPSRVAQEIFQP